jgi:hypothetical protein
MWFDIDHRIMKCDLGESVIIRYRLEKGLDSEALKKTRLYRLSSTQSVKIAIKKLSIEAEKCSQSIP